MAKEKLARFTISMNADVAKSIDRKAAKKKCSRSALIEETMVYYPLLQDVMQAASELLTLVPVHSENNRYLPGFLEKLEIYEKKREKYFAK